MTPRDLLVFRLGDARFGVWIDDVLEVVRTPPISRLPLPSAEVAGVTSVRGEVIPVLDLGVRLLGSPAARPGRLLIARYEEAGGMVALLVDDVETLLSVEPSALRDPPSAAAARLPVELVAGVVTSHEVVVTVLHVGLASAPPQPSTQVS